MKIIDKRVQDLKPYKNNPRKNDEAVDYVANSIKEFGFKVPIVIDTRNEVVAGHTRLKAAKQLGLLEVPCIIADDLTEDQIRAFRLADNKTTEMSTWDMSMLDIELDEIQMDMSRFGFEFPEEELIDFKENERERTASAYNLSDYDEDLTEGYYQMPVLKPCNRVPKDLIGFNYMMSSDNKECGIHFYVDDYQFERIWNNPKEYIDRISEYQCMLSPDFSLYREMPIAMKIWNVYRSRLVGQIYQRNGIKVIPTVSWCEEDTFDFCFDGLPHNATLSISTIGVKDDDESFGIWKAGVDEMVSRLTPKRLLIYGGEVDYDYGNIKIKYYGNHVTENMKNISRRKQDEI